MVDIEINAWSSLFFNLETNQSCTCHCMYKIQTIRVAYQKPGYLKFCAPFKINIQKREGLSKFEKPVFDFSVTNPKKSWLGKKLKVTALDIRIEQSGLKVSHSVSLHSLFPASINFLLSFPKNAFRRLNLNLGSEYLNSVKFIKVWSLVHASLPLR